MTLADLILRCVLAAVVAGGVLFLLITLMVWSVTLAEAVLNWWYDKRQGRRG